MNYWIAVIIMIIIIIVFVGYSSIVAGMIHRGGLWEIIGYAILFGTVIFGVPGLIIWASG